MVRKVAERGQPTACPVSASISSMVKVHLLHQSHHVEYGKCADAVCDEVGSVFCQHDALAELCVAKVGNGFRSARVGIGRGDEFKQAHVARRIEEVGAKPGAAEVGRKSLGDFCHGKPAGVGGDDGAGLRMASTFLAASV